MEDKRSAVELNEEQLKDASGGAGMGGQAVEGVPRSRPGEGSALDPGPNTAR